MTINDEIDQARKEENKRLNKMGIVGKQIQKDRVHYSRAKQCENCVFLTYDYKNAQKEIIPYFCKQLKANVSADHVCDLHEFHPHIIQLDEAQKQLFEKHTKAK